MNYSTVDRIDRLILLFPGR